MKIEESLNGNYASLYGEVVTEDIYKVKNLPFVPNVVLDLGANVGIFTRYARDLWPEALIVSVEPNEDNIEVFKSKPTENSILIETGIGNGIMYQCLQAANGAMEVYLSKGLGYSQQDLDKLIETPMKGIMLTDLKRYVKGRVMLKLDIEGNETVIFNDTESMAMLKTFDYIAMELHYYAADGSKIPEVRMVTDEALASLAETHITHYDHIYFYALKKEYAN